MATPNCLLVDNDEAIAYRGYMVGCNQSGCPVTTCPFDQVLVAPIFTCPVQEISYERPIESDSVYMQYWSNCVATVSGLPSVSATNQGFINQLFCDFDANGYPMAPASIGAPLAGIVSQLPSLGGRMQDLALELNPATGCPSGSNSAMELIQSDFWILVPDNIQEIGFKVGGGAADAALFMVGTSLTDLCATSELLDGASQGVEGIPESYYTVPSTATSNGCAGKYLRVRFYTTDIAAGFNTTPEVDFGSGFDALTNFDEIVVIPAAGPNDNVPPAPPTELLTGYVDVNNNLFAEDAQTYEPLGCITNSIINTNAAPVTAICVNGVDLEFTLNLTSTIATTYTIVGATPTSGAFNSAGTFVIAGGATGLDHTITVTDDNTGCPISIIVRGAVCSCAELIAAGADICALITANLLSPIATMDCDGGGVDNATECLAGNNPNDAVDDCDLGLFDEVCTVGQGNIGPVGVALDGTESPFMATPNCLLLDNAEATNYRGHMIGCNQTGCPTSLHCFESTVFEPVFNCPVVEIEYEVPISGSVYFQYWSDCVPTMDSLPSVAAINQGFINQLFCDFDINGYPMAPTSIGTPVAGVVSRLPQSGGLTDDLVAEIDPSIPCENNTSDMELIQSDFWILVPDSVTVAGFRLGGPGADASLFLVGTSVTDMCATAELVDNASGTEGIAEAYYTIPSTATVSSCAGKYLRVRLYTTDIAAAFNTTPEVDFGSGFDAVTNAPGVAIFPATGPNDNVPPVPQTETLTGYLDGDGNIFASNASTYEQLGCATGTVISSVPISVAGACINGADLEFSLNLPSIISTTYDVAGATPISGAYNAATTFTIAGGADGTDKIITVTDPTTGCPIDITVSGDMCTCAEIIADGVDLCAILLANPASPLATLDCDGGGIDNLTECQNGQDPLDAADDCTAAMLGMVDICVFVISNPTSSLALADCDGGGINNLTECLTGEDPFDPSDDCQSAIDGMVDICPFVLANPTSPLALADCDGGGISNVVECMSGEDPLDPVDDCMAAISGMVDICAIVLADPTSPLATLDCDGGGVNNLTECMTGENPSDASDDCMSAVDSGLDICAIITADPTSPFATLDCDGGGIINSVECANGDDPLDPIDDNQSCMDVMASGESICDVLTADPNNPLATMDCDGGGVDNATECANGGDPADYRDECGVAMTAGLDICAIIAANPSAMIGMLDCDGGGIINSIECAAGLNPSNPSDDCDAAIDQNVNICNLISADPTHPLAALDCDGGGVSNANECASGENPLEWADDCQSAIDLGLDLCAFILANPTSLTALADCDGGGVNNLTECQNGGDPFDPADDCLVAVTTGLDICALIAANPTSPLALADCDGGGVNNFTECQTGNNPANPADDCMSALDFGIDICTIILNDPTHPLAFSDCDGGGAVSYTHLTLPTTPYV